MRKQCKRKVYALVNPITHAIEGAAITPEDELRTLRLRELAAIDAFAKGLATEREWQDICAMLNLTEVLARRGVGPEALPYCEALQEHLAEAVTRYRVKNRMGTTGPGLQAMRDVFQFHDLQRQSISRSEYEKAIADAINKIKGRAPEVAIV